MADTTALKNRIRAAIKQNNNQEITGPILQNVLLDIVDELGDRIINEYNFVGIAVPTTSAPSGLTEYSRIFYLAIQNGTYTNLGNVRVSNEIAIIKYNGSSWSKESLIAIDEEPTAGSNNLVKSGGVKTSLNTSLNEAGNGFLYANFIRNGGAGNYGNAYKVCTYGIDVRGIDYIIPFTDRPVENGRYRYGIIGTSATEAINKSFAKNNNPNNYPILQETSNVESGTEIKLNEGVNCVIVEVCVIPSGGREGDIVLRQGDFVGYNIGFQNSAMSHLYEIEELVSNKLLNFYRYYQYVRFNVYPNYTIKELCTPTRCLDRGSISQRGSYYATEFYIPFRVGDSISGVARAYKTSSVLEVYDLNFELKSYVSAEGASVDSIIDFTAEENCYIRIGYSTLLDVTLSYNNSYNYSNYSPWDVGLLNDIIIASEIEKAMSSDNIYTRNEDRIPMLTAACRYRKTSDNAKDFQLLIVADSHSDNPVTDNAITATNEFTTIDAVIHMGDVIASYLNMGQNTTIWSACAAKCVKPFYCVIGNHEAGTFDYVYSNPYESELYRSFVKPSVDAGHLIEGEYVENKCYYYHDFSQYSLRLIVVNEYQTPRIFNETYWRAIEYDNTLPNQAFNTNYHTGDKVNVPNYTEYSFEAVSDFNSGSFYSNGKLPSYIPRKHRWISEEQAQWFLDTLFTTPENYGVIVACHHPFSMIARTLPNKMFNQTGEDKAGSFVFSDLMSVDFLADAVNAFSSGIAYTATVESTSQSFIASYTVSKDFSNKNSGAHFHSFLGGHAHRDLIWKHPNYNQYQVAPICANTNNYAQCTGADIRRPNSNSVDRIDVDCLTVASYANDRIALVKLGVNVTENGEKRDFEVVDIS
jgi:hypothetical protein